MLQHLRLSALARIAAISCSTVVPSRLQSQLDNHATYLQPSNNGASHQVLSSLSSSTSFVPRRTSKGPQPWNLAPVQLSSSVLQYPWEHWSPEAADMLHLHPQQDPWPWVEEEVELVQDGAGVAVAALPGQHQQQLHQELCCRYFPIDLHYPGLKLVSRHPPVFTVEGFLAPAACEALIQAGAANQQHMQPSDIGADGTPGAATCSPQGCNHGSMLLLTQQVLQANSGAAQAAQQLQQAAWHLAQAPQAAWNAWLLQRMEQRQHWSRVVRRPHTHSIHSSSRGGDFTCSSGGGHLAGSWPLCRDAHPLLLHYSPGEYTAPHCDGRRAGHMLQTGVQHRAELLVFLNTLDQQQGGAAVFPELGLEVQPQQGMALLWFDAFRTGVPDTRTVHGSAPAAAAGKWVVGVSFVTPLLQQYNGYLATHVAQQQAQQHSAVKHSRVAPVAVVGGPWYHEEEAETAAAGTGTSSPGEAIARLQNQAQPKQQQQQQWGAPHPYQRVGREDPEAGSSSRTCDPLPGGAWYLVRYPATSGRADGWVCETALAYDLIADYLASL